MKSLKGLLGILAFVSIAAALISLVPASNAGAQVLNCGGVLNSTFQNSCEACGACLSQCNENVAVECSQNSSVSAGSCVQSGISSCVTEFKFCASLCRPFQSFIK